MSSSDSNNSKLKRVEITGFDTRPLPPRYIYYVTYCGHSSYGGFTWGASELPMLEDKIEHTAQLVEMHERLKILYASQGKPFAFPPVIMSWTFLRKEEPKQQ